LPSLSEILKQQKAKKDLKKKTRKDIKKIKSFDVDPETRDLTLSEFIKDIKMEDKTIPEEDDDYNERIYDSVQKLPHVSHDDDEKDDDDMLWKWFTKKKR